MALDMKCLPQLPREDRVLAMVGQALEGDPRLADLVASPAIEGLRGLTLGEFADAVRELPGQRAASLAQRLSGRELEVVRLIAEGLSNKEIGGRLSVSDKTVKNHISHILGKLQLRARTQVAVLALRGGIA